MNKTLDFIKNIASGHKISRQGSVTRSYLDFLFVRGLNYLQGVLHSSSLPDYIEDKKSGGQQQSNLYSVSAGSDLRMSPLRPNPLLSIEIEMRKSEFRGFFQFLSRPI